MKEEDKIKMREIIAVLQRIDNGESVPPFLILFVQYKKFGLHNSTGKKWGINAELKVKLQRGHTFI